ncbi:MAG: hypothetical protein ABI921_04755 [Panacibacter sp.]
MNALQVTRKRFLNLASLGIIGLNIPLTIVARQQQKPPALDAALVKDYVTKAHADLPGLTALLQQQPALLNASWDWGGGDFESALEAAGHMGRKDIAAFLLSNGARMNIFCAAMLGKINVVKSILTVYPDLKSSKGPHGLQLLHHARHGGDEAKEVLQYLESIGAS